MGLLHPCRKQCSLIQQFHIRPDLWAFCDVAGGAKMLTGGPLVLQCARGVHVYELSNDHECFLAGCSKVKLPTMYAPGDNHNAKTFNCIQRAHQNTGEGIGMVLVMECMLGLYHPITAACFGAVWTIGAMSPLSFAVSQASQSRIDIVHAAAGMPWL